MVFDETISKVICRLQWQFKKAGVLCLDLVKDLEQASLFRPVDPAREEKERRLMAAADAFNQHYGRGTVRTATAGFAQRWQTLLDQLSPRYTTRLADVLRARL